MVVAVAGVVWILDRVTKVIVNSTLALGEEVPVLPVFSWIRRTTKARRSAFSQIKAAGSAGCSSALAVAFSIYLVSEIRRLPAHERLLGWAYGLVLGGALGNLWDRALHGYVVDFALAHYGDHYFPVFNVADSAISIGAALWIVVDVARRASRAHCAHRPDHGSV